MNKLILGAILAMIGLVMAYITTLLGVVVHTMFDGIIFGILIMLLINWIK